ncbi:metallophosphoesterase family protein [Isoptericola dokdonensis]|jgi:predicted phosphodiesterase|uniref:Calcineurin-like phosphoesterase superfamily domain protein n=1 Tax=Isoptericola dokdonensis DS-3 TaxID=1300344 RepID=A0A168EA74_9MICO|nr:metallophosphoesterase [Isoptericola dokdonensis]ANC29788.1 Calcineurin-like phosphoesterase superfamily domain protein [Isoptericola dokdonensis DS-3]
MTDRRTPPRWLRWTLAVVAAVVASVLYGVTTASAVLGLGPHEALYEVDTDGLVVVDLGPLGTLEIDSPLPAGLGVDVTVKEIPADLTAVGGTTTLDRLAGDLDGYLQFYASPSTTFDAVTHALLGDAARRAAFALAVIGLSGWGVALLLGGPRRRELGRVLGPRTWQITAGVAVVSLLGATAVASGVEQPVRGRPASAVFDGTALEGATITGRLARVIDTYGGQLVALYDDNEEFYAGARDEVAAAWRAWEVRHAVRVATGTVEADAEDVVTMLVVSDLHCNAGMAGPIEELATRAGVDVMLNAGDTTMNGTAVEKVCVDAFADAVPDGVPMVVADGNHDSRLTSQQEAARGQLVLDGDVEEVAGVRILGDRDVLETRVGEGTSVARERTPTEQAGDLAEAACDDGDVDLLLIHTPPVGNRALESGCVPFQVSGHTHRRAGPEQIGQGLRYVSASTAGAASGQATVGPLRGTAEMTLLRFDPTTRTMLDLQVVAVTPDGSATVYDREVIPVPVPPVGQLEAPGADGAGEATPGPGAGSPTPSSSPSAGTGTGTPAP